MNHGAALWVRFHFVTAYKVPGNTCENGWKPPGKVKVICPSFRPNDSADNGVLLMLWIGSGRGLGGNFQLGCFVLFSLVIGYRMLQSQLLGGQIFRRPRAEDYRGSGAKKSDGVGLVSGLSAGKWEGAGASSAGWTTSTTRGTEVGKSSSDIDGEDLDEYPPYAYGAASSTPSSASSALLLNGGAPASSASLFADSSRFSSRSSSFENVAYSAIGCGETVVPSAAEEQFFQDYDDVGRVEARENSWGSPNFGDDDPAGRTGEEGGERAMLLAGRGASWGGSRGVPLVQRGQLDSARSTVPRLNAPSKSPEII